MFITCLVQVIQQHDYDIHQMSLKSNVDIIDLMAQYSSGLFLKTGLQSQQMPYNNSVTIDW
jgi:hypothetical protein